jgi:hypothetical protein
MTHNKSERIKHWTEGHVTFDGEIYSSWDETGGDTIYSSKDERACQVALVLYSKQLTATKDVAIDMHNLLRSWET